MSDLGRMESPALSDDILARKRDQDDSAPGLLTDMPTPVEHVADVGEHLASRDVHSLLSGPSSAEGIPPLLPLARNVSNAPIPFATSGDAFDFLAKPASPVSTPISQLLPTLGSPQPSDSAFRYSVGMNSVETGMMPKSRMPRQLSHQASRMSIASNISLGGSEQDAIVQMNESEIPARSSSAPPPLPPKTVDPTIPTFEANFSPVPTDTLHSTLPPRLSESGPSTSPQPSALPETTRPLSPIKPAPFDPRLANLPTRRWIDPSVFHEISSVDQVADPINKAFPSHDTRPTRKLLRAEDVEHDPDPFQRLLVSGSYRAAANLARRKILATSAGDIESLGLLWLIRLTCLCKLGLYDMAQLEIDKLSLESLDMRYERQRDVFPEMAAGSMAPFALRVLAARLPGLRGLHSDSVDLLYRLCRECRREARHLVATSGVKGAAADVVLWKSRDTQLRLLSLNALDGAA
jgi:hypothetical protein